MRWTGRRQSSNVEDRRGSGGGGMLKGGLGIGGILIVVVISLVMKKNPLEVLQQTGVGTGGTTTEERAPLTAEEEKMGEFVATVLADTEDVWHKLMSDYREPTLVLFTGQVASGCGNASSATGPFYCSADEKLYIDLSFYEELRSRFQAPGDFAQAYVIAHEVGHHVQHLMGTTDRVHSMRGQLSETEYNKQSVRLELQADFFAGVWAHHAQKMQNILEAGDIEEALGAATAIGDDRLQKQATGEVVPDSFTHGTSAQRVRWFKKGFETGDINQGDTFNTDDL
ncbi:KPN_02809 family neutral zinc metallopeptidase [Parachryseolinea silvisoli]|uniref:KPN_02809 family neutral zinc metallopeptidase n=1 Tax=Parachryseolinea silvisoli TaxID=2873601 RepID=UPI002265D819|nr:neutral zinc metallopeptidase [Parachryseolinea silvisoli]MCD9019601.1 zinc metallopeptidase [Parachryseolinea silvisoli]